MSWNKIEEHLFEKYCVEGEDKEFCKLMEEYDKEIRNNTIDELSCKLIMYFADCQLIEENAIARDFFDGVIDRIDEIAKRFKR